MSLGCRAAAERGNLGGVFRGRCRRGNLFWMAAKARECARRVYPVGLLPWPRGAKGNPHFSPQDVRDRAPSPRGRWRNAILRGRRIHTCQAAPTRHPNDSAWDAGQDGRGETQATKLYSASCMAKLVRRIRDEAGLPAITAQLFSHPEPRVRTVH